jgi:hypothetical protein
MNAYGGVEKLIHFFLTPVLVFDCSASGPGRFSPGKALPNLKQFITTQ